MENKHEIFEKVIVLYKKYGIKSVTMEDVSRELGISKKTLYNFIKDKEDLINQVIDHEFKLKENCFDRIINKDLNAIEQLFEVNNYMKEQIKYFSPSLDYDLRKYYPHIYNDLHKKKRESMFQSVRDNINQGKKEGIYREDVNPELIAKLYVGRMENVHDDEYFPAEEFISPEAFKDLFIYHIRGIANEKGIKILEENIEKLKNSETNEIQ